jgi:hypothetical protein
LFIGVSTNPHHAKRPHTHLHQSEIAIDEAGKDTESQFHSSD